MPVKHWSFAGLMVTYRCPAACACCYVCSSPTAGGDMSVENALAWWQELQQAGPHGCRIHIGGGEPFVRWEALIEICRQARSAGLGPLEAVETNAFWATDRQIVAERLQELDAAGMGRLTISADPYHQQFVHIERPRLAAAVAAEVLGPERVRVRWQDWLAEGHDLTDADEPTRRAVFGQWLSRRRERLTGRAAMQLPDLIELKPASHFADNPCAQSLLRCRHVHIDGEGNICPGTCAGIILGRAGQGEPIAAIWRKLYDEHAAMEVIGPLASRGPVALLELARPMGYQEQPGYAGKCHLCYHVRKWLFDNGHYPGRLGPAALYRP